MIYITYDQVSQKIIIMFAFFIKKKNTKKIAWFSLKQIKKKSFYILHVL